MTDEDRLSGFLDRELDAEEKARLEAMLASDETLRDRLARMRGRDALVRRAFEEEVPGDAVPERFIAVIDAGLDRASTPAPVKDSDRPTSANDNSLRWRLGGAMAASLAAGLLLGSQFISNRAGGVLPGLESRLETTPSGRTVTLASGERLTPQLTFPRRGHGWCRQFLLSGSKNARAGIACRDERWSVEALLPTTRAGSGQDGFVVAEGSSEPALDQVVDGLRGGDALDPTAERTLIKRGWQSP